MVEKNTFSSKLFIKRKKLLKNGQAPVYIRITVRGERKEIATTLSVFPEHWDTGRDRVKPAVADAMDTNNYLGNLLAKIQDLKRQIVDRGQPLTAKALRDASGPERRIPRCD